MGLKNPNNEIAFSMRGKNNEGPDSREHVEAYWMRERCIANIECGNA